MVLNNCPLVTIITPVYNGSDYLEELIQSVLNQKYPNIEHIVIDDGSQDNGATVAILHKYPHLHWWSHANKGQYATMNDGIGAARGEIICFVSADDLVSTDAVEVAAQYLMAHPFMDGMFGITNYIDQNGRDRSYPVPFRLAPIHFYPYFAHISHCSFYVKKTSIQKYGLSFDPTLRLVGDYEWLIRVYKARLRIGMVRQELAKVRIHAGQASQNYHDASVSEARAVLKAHHINKIYYLLLSTINLLLIRTGKVISLMQSLGLRDTIIYLMKRTNQI